MGSPFAPTCLLFYVFFDFGFFGVSGCVVLYFIYKGKYVCGTGVVLGVIWRGMVGG